MGPLKSLSKLILSFTPHSTNINMNYKRHAVIAPCCFIAYVNLPVAILSITPLVAIWAPFWYILAKNYICTSHRSLKKQQTISMYKMYKKNLGDDIIWKIKTRCWAWKIFKVCKQCNAVNKKKNPTMISLEPVSNQI